MSLLTPTLPPANHPGHRPRSTRRPDLPTASPVAPDLAPDLPPGHAAGHPGGLTADRPTEPATGLAAELTPPRLAGRFVRAAVLATGLAIGLGVSVPVLPGIGHLQPAFPVPLTVVPRQVLPSNPAVELRRAAAAATAAAGHRCGAVDSWPAGNIPLGAVMTPHLAGRRATTARWYPFDQAWALAQQGRADTVLLCAG